MLRTIARPRPTPSPRPARAHRRQSLPQPHRARGERLRDHPKGVRGQTPPHLGCDHESRKTSARRRGRRAAPPSARSGQQPNDRSHMTPNDPPTGLITIELAVTATNERADTAGTALRALRTALRTDNAGPCLVDLHVGGEEHVAPAASPRP